MKKIIFIILILLCFLFLNAKKMYTLKELVQPNQIAVSEEKLYAVCDASVYVFSLKNGKLISFFGKKGEGPGEFNTNHSFDMFLNIKPLKNKLFLYTSNKFSYMNLDGKLISEKKLAFISINIKPISNVLAVKRYIMQGTTPQYTICLIDKNLNLIKNLKTVNYNYKPGVFEPIQEYFDFRTYKDRIYILYANNEILVSVYNKKGEKTSTISVKHKPVQLTDKHKKLAQEFLKRKSWFKMIPSEYKKKTIYPKFLPACKNFLIYDDKIFIHTFKQSGEKTEFLIVSINNNAIQKAFLPVYDINLLEFTPYTIHKNIYYYLKENINEEWELHSNTIIPINTCN